MPTNDKMNEVTSTPRTDAEIARALQAHGKGGTIMVYKLNDMEAFARQLELDAATWRAKAKRWQEIADQRAIEVADLKVATPSAVAEQEPDTVQRRAREWDALHTTIREFVGDYYMPGDGGDYNPPPEIRAVICDAVHGLIGEEDFLNALVKVYSVRSRFAPSASAPSEAIRLLREWMKKAKAHPETREFRGGYQPFLERATREFLAATDRGTA